MTADDVRAALSAAGVELGPPRQVDDESGTLTAHRIVHPVLSGHLIVSTWLDGRPPTWSLQIRPALADPSGSGWAPINIWSGDIRIPTADARRAATEVCGQLASPEGIAECVEYRQTRRQGPILTRCAEWTWRAP
jgi:hypothetical protein